MLVNREHMCNKSVPIRTFLSQEATYMIIHAFITSQIDHCNSLHDDVLKWKHFPRYWPFVRGIHRSPVNSPHKGQWRGALMFSLICVWINGWVNNREAGDLRRYRANVINGLPEHLIKKLQRVQNTAARLAFNLRKYDHITPALVTLHWLPVKYRINL